MGTYEQGRLSVPASGCRWCNDDPALCGKGRGACAAYSAEGDPPSPIAPRSHYRPDCRTEQDFHRSAWIHWSEYGDMDGDVCLLPGCTWHEPAEPRRRRRAAEPKVVEGVA